MTFKCLPRSRLSPVLHTSGFNTELIKKIAHREITFGIVGAIDLLERESEFWLLLQRKQPEQLVLDHRRWCQAFQV